MLTIQERNTALVLEETIMASDSKNPPSAREILLLGPYGVLGTGVVECMQRTIDLQLRCDARTDQALLPVVLALLVRERVLRRRQFRLPLPVVCLQRFDLQQRRGKLRVRLLYSDTERRVVEAE